jgi:hypothetical protein
MTLREVFDFPNPVNEVSARLVAAGAVLMAALFVVTGWTWVLVPLAFGFVARVLAGPRFSPLARLVTQVITPRLPVEPRLVAGPPKRFAQGVGAVFTVTALVLAFGFGAVGAARVVVALLAAAAFLEAAFAFCLGCRVFAVLMKAGVIPERVCAECNDISGRLAAATGAVRPGA